MNIHSTSVAIWIAGAFLLFACVGVTWLIAKTAAARTEEWERLAERVKNGWPGRRHLCCIAAGFTAIAICGSLVPLRFEPLDFEKGLRSFAEIPHLALGVQSRADWVANILLFIPIGFFWLGAITVDCRALRRSVAGAMLVVGVSIALSVVLEFTQQWFPPRTVSQNDIVAEGIGAVLGAGLWLLVGQTLTDWGRSYTVSLRQTSQIDWLLQIYFLGLLIYSVLPLDLTIRFSEIADKYRAGRICLRPFSEGAANFAAVYGMIRDVVVFVPVGILASTWSTRPDRPLRSISQSTLLGGLVAFLIELAQLLVYSRITSTGDVITGILGVFVGALIIQFWRRNTATGPQSAPPKLIGRQTWLWLGAAFIYATVLVTLYCWPFDFIHDAGKARARYQGFFAVPFARFYHGTEFNAISQVLNKTLFFAAFGALLALVAYRAVVPPAVRPILLFLGLMVVAMTGLCIEMTQVFMRSHRPDITDAILYSSGGAVGMFVTLWIVGHGSH